MRILHLSDTHLFGDNTWHYGIVDTTAALHRVLAAAEHIGDIDAVIVSGDLSEDGSTESYRRLQRIVGTWADNRGAPVVYAMGNHDDASAFEAVLGDRAAVRDVAGFRVVTLDSSVPGFGYGALDEGELRWLADALRDSALPAVVVVHHPPTPAGSTLLGALELQHPEKLLDLCADAGVVAILSGHYHHPLVTAERGVPIIVAPAVANTSDPYAPAGRERARIGSGYAVIDLTTTAAPRVTFHTAPSPDDGSQIFDLDPDQVAAIAAQAGVPTTPSPGTAST